ncbi:MAG: Lrp/AsnC family transcriptional regulator [Euryarchaeota archaeon]|nr:Lrp/AsnC family transcriptional regulator [Euryarchaeota archaeon]
MSKSSTQQLVQDEQKILDVLRTNANESIDVIAKKCGFSRQKVWRIIKKLEKNKTIWGYTAICDDESCNLKHFTMLIKRTTVPIDQKMLQEVLKTRLDNLIPGSVIHIENIEYFHGCFDGICTFLAEDLVTAKKFCEQFNKRFSQFIADVEILEGILIIRKQAVRNPRLKEQIKFL